MKFSSQRHLISVSGLGQRDKFGRPPNRGNREAGCKKERGLMPLSPNFCDPFSDGCFAGFLRFEWEIIPSVSASDFLLLAELFAHHPDDIPIRQKDSTDVTLIRVERNADRSLADHGHLRLPMIVI